MWERLASRTKPSGALAALESPRTVAKLVTGALGGATFFAAVFAVVLFRSGEMVSGWATLGLAIAYAGIWVWTAAIGGVAGPAMFACVASMADQIIVQIALGGYANSGAYLMWGITMTFALVIMMGRRPALIVAGVYAVLGVVFGFLEPTLAASRPPPSSALTSALFAVVFVGNLAMVTSVLVYLLVRLAYERERAESLLLNVLPAQVATELKERGRTTAKRFSSTSVLFADVVGFTEMSAGMDPEEMLDILNEVFTYFDTLARRYGCEKIRTIGDAYMVACGVPVPRPNHARALAEMALDMRDYASRGPLTFRLGINSGPVVAGVIGTSKFQYDVWGDTVNTASRMESHGEPGQIQISEATYELIKDDFVCTARGPIEVKSKGTLRTWYLERGASDRDDTVSEA